VPEPGAGAAVQDPEVPDVAATEVPPELVATTLGQYLRAWWARVRAGDSGILPVLLALIVVFVTFQILSPKFLGAQNLVNLLEQSTIYMVLAMAEIFVLLLAEIDLSVGLVMALSAVVVAQLVQPGSPGFPWWLAILGAVGVSAAVGGIQGTLVARLRMPSFIVTLGSLLILEGVGIIVLGGSLAGTGNDNVPAEVKIHDIFWGQFSPVVGWILLVAVLAVWGTMVWRRSPVSWS
jgi:D-xylose transport system permease protein